MNNCIYPSIGEERDLPIYIIGVECGYHPKSSFREEGFPYYQLVMVVDGEAKLKWGKKEYSINTFNVIIAPPNTEYQFINEGMCVLNRLIFDGCDVPRLLKPLNLSDLCIIKLKEKCVAQDFFDNIFKHCYADSNFCGYKNSHTLYAFLIELSIHKKMFSSKNEDAKILSLKPILAYIDEKFSKDITLEELSLVSGYSPQYICRLFKECLNTRPFEYIARIRIKNAKEILLSTESSINEIAERVGFNDASYFCALFKRYELISPNEFRNLYKK